MVTDRLFQSFLVGILFACGGLPPRQGAAVEEGFPNEVKVWCDALGWDLSYEDALVKTERQCSALDWNKYSEIEFHVSKDQLSKEYRLLYDNVLPAEVPEIYLSIRIEQLWSPGSTPISIWYVRSDQGPHLLTNIFPEDGLPPWSRGQRKTVRCSWHDVPPGIAERFDRLLDDQRIWEAPPNARSGEETPVAGISLYKNGRSHQVIGFSSPLEFFLQEPWWYAVVRETSRPPSTYGEQGLGELLVNSIEAARTMLIGPPYQPVPRPSEGLLARYDALVREKLGWDNAYLRECADAVAPDDYLRAHRTLAYFPSRWPDSLPFSMVAKQILDLLERRDIERAVRLEWPNADLTGTSLWVLAGSDEAYIVLATAQWAFVDEPGPGFEGHSEVTRYFIVKPVRVEEVRTFFEGLDKYAIENQASYIAWLGRPSYISWYASGRSNQFVMYDFILSRSGEVLGEETMEPAQMHEHGPSAESRRQCLEIEHEIRSFVMKHTPLDDPDEATEDNDSFCDSVKETDVDAH